MYRQDRHRPVVGGIKITVGRPSDQETEDLGGVTLTALATKNGTSKKVLVTCLHVMA